MAGGRVLVEHPGDRHRRRLTARHVGNRTSSSPARSAAPAARRRRPGRRGSRRPASNLAIAPGAGRCSAFGRGWCSHRAARPRRRVEPSSSNCPKRHSVTTAPCSAARRRGPPRRPRARSARTRPRTGARTRPSRRSGARRASVALTDDPKIATTATIAMPTMSAAAVDAVRRGLRAAFSWASRPDIPRNRAGNHPRTRPTARPTSGLSIATPMKTSAAPTPTAAATPPGNQSTPPKRPSTTSTTPTTANAPPTPIAAPPGARRAARRSRSAAIGETRAARRAGATAETNVITVPTTSETTIVRGRDDRRARRQVEPDRAASAAWSPMATRIPRTSPRIDDSSPTTKASIATEPVTCRPKRRAPASDRARACAERR